MATNCETARPSDAEILPVDIRSAPKLALARPPPARQTVQKGRLNFLYSNMLNTFFSIIVGAGLAIATLLLVGIYWLFALLARIVSLVLLPFRKLFSALKSS
jgi:hypothetical protein